MYRLEKTPEGVLYYTVQWLAWLAGDTLSQSAWTADEGLTIVPASDAIRQGTFQASGASLAGSRSVGVSGLSLALGQGYDIQFAGHSQVYTLTDDADAGGDTLRITPPLKHDVADLEAIAYSFTLVQLSGGDNGKEYDVTNSVTTSSGEEEAVKITFEVRRKG